MHKQYSLSDDDLDSDLTPTYASRFLNQSIDKYIMPSASLSPDIVYRLIKDEIELDGNAHKNLATFVTTWMEPQAASLMKETFEKNIIDKDEYPQTAELENRCIHILANLWHAPDNKDIVGTSTIGSSEACMLAGLAFKWQWRQKNNFNSHVKAKPNLVLGANAQICWHKFCKYWDIEPRYIPLEEGRYHIDSDLACEACDNNTIGVVGIMGSTLDGSYEPIEELCHKLDKLQQLKGLDIPVHVDAASGGFVAPFIQPDLVWDFRLLRVKSINTSGHKYGMVYPGVGWIVWRHPNDLPQDLIFDVNYLGGNMPSFTLNFSKPGNSVIAQYYNFLRLGYDGYKRIMMHCRDTAMYLSAEIEKLTYFKLISRGDDLPVFAFSLADDEMRFSLYDLSEKLRSEGWQVPVYSMPKNIDQVTVMRIVVKENFSHDMADLLLASFNRAIDKLLIKGSASATNHNQSFHH